MSDNQIYEININEIMITQNQTRKISLESPDIVELANNIMQVGLLNPVIVKPIDFDKYKWELIAGERRLTAFKILGRSSIQAYIIAESKDNQNLSWAIAVSENLMRKQLTPSETQQVIEIARGELNMKQNDIAQSLGLSNRRLQQIQGVEKLPDDLCDVLDDNKKLTKRNIDAFKLIISSKILSR
jgi:ParB family chromosome partitioning protein